MALMLVMLKIALHLFLIFWLKKPGFCTANSTCYALHGEEVVDIKDMLIPQSLWCYQQINCVCAWRKPDLRLLLLLGGDIELCPGPQQENILIDNPELEGLAGHRGLKCLHLNV